EFTYADVRSIPYPDNHFDVVRAERLFQVLPQEIDPESVLREMARVAKENGMIVLADTDWGSASIDYHDDELTDRLLYFFGTRCRPSGFAGRQFYGLLRRNGISILEVEVKPILMFDFNETPFKQWLTKEALDNNIATKTELDSWNDELVKKTEKNEFFSCANMILISGRI
ncbi:MAG: methyltransferase domain-containing protein, partial [Candidatus Aquicultor sp.]